jgi:hypothetical protein
MGLLFGGLTLYMTMSSNPLILPFTLASSAAASIVGMTIEYKFGAGSLPSNIISGVLSSVFVYKIVRGILFSNIERSKVKGNSDGQIPTSIANISERTLFVRTPIWMREFRALQGLIEQLSKLDKKTNIASTSKKEVKTPQIYTQAKCLQNSGSGGSAVHELELLF